MERRKGLEQATRAPRPGIRPVNLSGREPATNQTLHTPLQLEKQIATSMADSSSRFGFVAFAETWNGRMAMMGFVIGLATELLTGQGILQQIGLG
jgi:ferrochelatase